jgi:hypothetical protein
VLRTSTSLKHTIYFHLFGKSIRHKKSPHRRGFYHLKLKVIFYVK